MSLVSISVMYKYAWPGAGDIVSLSLLFIFLHWQLVAAQNKRKHSFNLPPRLLRSRNDLVD